MGYVVRGRCRTCGKVRLSPVDTANKRKIAELFSSIRDYYCPGGHYDLERSFLEGYEWDFSRIERLNGQFAHDPRITPQVTGGLSGHR